MDRDSLAACRLSDLPPGEGYRFDGDTPIALFNVDGEIYAIDDTCSHQEASLSAGWLEGHTVECPVHASRFDLRTGRPDGPPAKQSVRTYPVTVCEGVVHVHLADRADS
jgi:3-phenylpropionate/trans-cinnamate dioxygenase ferredoxin component